MIKDIKTFEYEGNVFDVAICSGKPEEAFEWDRCFEACVSNKCLIRISTNKSIFKGHFPKNNFDLSTEYGRSRFEEVKKETETSHFLVFYERLDLDDNYDYIDTSSNRIVINRCIEKAKELIIKTNKN